jgi:hypothetical protein
MPQVYSGQRVTAAAISVSYALSDQTLFSIGAATTLTQICNGYSIAAGEPAAGSVYRLRAYGNGTQGSTAQGLTFAASFGGLTTGTGIAFGSGFAGTSTAFRWWVEAEAMCLSTGSSATWQVSLTGMCGSGTSTTASGVAQNASPLAVSTAAAIPFEIVAEWGSATGAPTAAGLRSVFQRLL